VRGEEKKRRKGANQKKLPLRFEKVRFGEKGCALCPEPVRDYKKGIE